MIYDNGTSLLLCTGLTLTQLRDVISDDENEVENNLKKFGPKYLERYIAFKMYRRLVSEGSLKEPIIPIIGAMPCVGKTSMAREIATAFGIGNVIGGDSFRAALREFIPKEKNPEFFTSVYDAWKFFGKKNKVNTIKGFDGQARIINRAIQRMVADRGIRDGESMVFEYLHFMPSQYDNEVIFHPSVIPIVLRIDSENLQKERIAARDRTTHLKGDSARLLDALEAYRAMQEHQCDDARKKRIPVIPTDDWNKAIDEVLTIITKRIKELNESKCTRDPAYVDKIRKERKA